jgi:hypothetical protein
MQPENMVIIQYATSRSDSTQTLHALHFPGFSGATSEDVQPNPLVACAIPVKRSDNVLQISVLRT